jgi:putative copper resistance protein D
VTSIDAWLIAVRAGHFLACMLLFGEALYVCTIDPRARLRGWVILGAVPFAAACAIGWLGIEAVVMSGEAPAQALRSGVVGVVVHSTQFGHVWLVRVCGVGMVALAAWITLRTANAGLRRTALAATLLLAALHLALLALAGHAGAAGGLRRVAEVGVDAVHLLAAGAWLGSLPALVAALASTASRDTVVRITRRYSQVGCVAVTAVVASGIVNAGFRSVGPMELVTTDYGRLLLIKLAFVAGMLALAATNRFAVTPRLRDADGRALAALRRNAWVEIGIGIVVVVLVGALGITPPPAMDMSHAMH